MLTTGAKLYFGLAAVAGVVLAVLGWATRWSMQPTLGAGSALAAFLFLGGLTLYVRDDEATVSLEDTVAEAPAPRHATWSVAAAFGAALVVVGLPVDSRLFVAGLVVIGVSILEWAVQSWADRASADAVYNDQLRGRLMHPLEFPVAGALAFGVIVFGFSRVMVALSKDAAIVAFAVIGALVMGIAALLGTRPQLSRKVLGGVLSVSAVVLLAGGVAGVSHGFRSSIRAREAPESACDSDKLGSHTASDKASIAAVVSYDGRVFAPDSFVAGRNANLTVIFKNIGDGETKLVVHAGEQPKLDAAGQPLKAPDGSTITEPLDYCTYFVRPSTQQALTVKFPQPGSYKFEAEARSGGNGGEGSVIVP
jgi:hypothetical protein